MKPEVVITRDGSMTLLHPELGEHYHSIHGARSESERVYIECGLAHAAENFNEPIKILEIGIGTGLNAVLAGDFASRTQRNVHYTGLEPFPIDSAYAASLPVRDISVSLGMEQLYDMLHNQELTQAVIDSFSFNVLPIKLEDYISKAEDNPEYHTIFFDAFAPDTQPELWEESVFKFLFKKLLSGGNLVTYCVKGEVRRRLQHIGFSIHKLAGPQGGKREILRAVKTL